MTKEELKKEAKENFEQYKLKDEDYVEYDGEKILMFNREYYAEDEYFRFYSNGYLASAEPREKRIAELEQQVEQFQKMYNEQKETLKKVRVALIKERTANIMNYGKGGVEMFDNMFEILKGVSN